MKYCQYMSETTVETCPIRKKMSTLVKNYKLVFLSIKGSLMVTFPLANHQECDHRWTVLRFKKTDNWSWLNFWNVLGASRGHLPRELLHQDDGSLRSVPHRGEEIFRYRLFRLSVYKKLGNFSKQFLSKTDNQYRQKSAIRPKKVQEIPPKHSIWVGVSEVAWHLFWPVHILILIFLPICCMRSLKGEINLSDTLHAHLLSQIYSSHCLSIVAKWIT